MSTNFPHQPQNPRPEKVWNAAFQRWESPDRQLYWDGIRWVPVNQQPQLPKPPMSNRDRRHLVTGAFILVALFLMVVYAIGSSDDSTGNGYSNPDPSATAYMTDEDRYLAALDERGLYHREGDAGKIEVGYLICEARAAGYSREYIATEGYQGNQQTNAELSKSDVYFLIDTAMQYLC